MPAWVRRAGEVTEGADLARKRRLSARYDKERAKGPARLAIGPGGGPVRPFTRRSGRLRPRGLALDPAQGYPVHADQVRNGQRTGVSRDGGVHLWRFRVVDDLTVSPYRAHAPRRCST
ncbi:DNA-3-methyladenine glycosylase [Streptomyces sp. NPDC005251]|uniref:DNA-3-methyladenine glycosylase n=1 Tax=Streptomyces sp. NPDC005251 TaxID=3157166 RepID=UPI0033A46736